MFSYVKEVGWQREAEMIRYRDLTEAQKKVVCNGCGPKGGWFPVPEFFCHASCDHHDFNYWLGYREIDRKKADVQFYVEMKKDAGKSLWKHIIARGYYTAVRLFGAVCFHYADKERDEHDLLIAMIRYKRG